MDMKSPSLDSLYGNGANIHGVIDELFDSNALSTENSEEKARREKLLMQKFENDLFCFLNKYDEALSLFRETMSNFSLEAFDYYEFRKESKKINDVVINIKRVFEKMEAAYTLQQRIHHCMKQYKNLNEIVLSNTRNYRHFLGEINSYQFIMKNSNEYINDFVNMNKSPNLNDITENRVKRIVKSYYLYNTFINKKITPRIVIQKGEEPIIHLPESEKE